MHKVFIQLIVVPLVLFLAACDKSELKKEGTVVWYEAFALPAMMEKSVEVKNQDDVKKLLTEKWYSAFEVTKSLSAKKADVKSIVNCQEYFSNPGMTTVSPPDYGPYLGIGLMCKAARIISDAEPFKTTWLSDLQFDAQLPNKLPKQIAMVISTSESERIASDKSLVSWSDVEKIIKVEKKGPHKTNYHEVGGEQEMALMARGDFNHDGLEDWLIASSYAVKGGTYRSLRMFVITKTAADGKILLLEEMSQ